MADERNPKHTFYLFDDTDEVTSDLCGVCGESRESHAD